MAKLILKSPYLKPNAPEHLANYTQYIATRESVEMPADSKRHLPSTNFQKKVVKELLENYPDSKELFEYEDYEKNPTRGNADEFILRVAETHGELFGTRQKYVDYIATRPKVQKLAEHGLFTDEGIPVILSQAVKEVSEHQGNVWTHIISLCREDAERLGYNDADQWRALLCSQRNMIAMNMKIKPENFRWYAAFHNTDHHPHVHMMAFSSDPKEPWLSKEGIYEIKKNLAHEIFRQDNIQIYEKQTEYRDTLRQEGRKTAANVIQQINSRTYDNPLVENLLGELSDRLKNTKGKKTYMFLQPEDKARVDRIVDELSKDDRIAKLYNLWYEQKFNTIRNYTDRIPDKLPLFLNDEFMTFKNAIIKEALGLSSEHMPFDDEDQKDEPSSPEPPEQEPEADDTPSELFETYAEWNEGYREARKYWYGNEETKPDFPRAYALMLAEAEKGNVFAMHDTGKMRLDGIGCGKDEAAAHEWFKKAYQGFLTAETQWERNDYIQYRIGKMCAFGYGTEQSYNEAAEWYGESYAQKNPFAAYALAGLYYRGQGVGQDFEEALSLYLFAAQDRKSPNAYAMYELAKMYRDGVVTEPDSKKSKEWFGRAYPLFVSMERTIPDDKLQYRIGQMSMSGTGTPVNLDTAHSYFMKSAEFKNINALYGLGKLYLNKEFSGYDVQKAVRFLIEAAQNGHESAQYTVGKMFLLGQDAVQDVLFGLRWLEEAAKQKNQYAEYLLGREYLKGENLPKDTEKAVDFLTRSAAQGNIYAAYTLGKAYLDGTDLPRNLDKAIELLSFSADKGFEAADYVLGKLYCKGEFVPKDIPKAIEYLTRAASKGNQFAQYLLGKLYIRDEDIPKDADRALYWFSLSADQGNMYAQYALGKIYLFGRDIGRDYDKAIALLTASAEQGNPYAAQLLESIRKNGNWFAAMAVVRLLHQMSRLFRDKLVDDGKGRIGKIDKKLKRQIDEKKQAHGIKL